MPRTIKLDNAPVDNRGVKLPRGEARNYFAVPSETSCAAGVIVNSRSGDMIGNFFIMVIRRKYMPNLVTGVEVTIQSLKKLQALVA